MSPATSWTELTVTAAGWQQGIPVVAGNPDDYFVDVLFEGTVFFNPHAAHTELSVAATSGTELTTPATSWTELT